MFDASLLDEAGDGFADLLVAGPVLFLLLLPEIAHQLASAAHLQAADLHGHRAQPEPRAKLVQLMSASSFRILKKKSLNRFS